MDLSNIERAIEELTNLAAEMEQQGELQVGDVVNYTHEGNSGVAQIESIRGEMANVRVMAVAGDNYEPTDDVYSVPMEDLSIEGAPEQEESETSEEPVVDDPMDEEDIKKGVFVEWMSKYGQTRGKVEEVFVDEPAIIPETGQEITSDSPVALIEVFEKHDEKYEQTGVSVGIPCKDLTFIDPLDVRPRQLMMKVKNAEMEYDEKANIGWLKGIGSAYGKIDLGGDTVSKGAYNQTINHNDGKIQLSVDHGFRVKDVVGVAYIEDSEDGLSTNSKMPLHIPHVKDAYEMAKFMLAEGKPLGYSIEYTVKKSKSLPDGVRELKEIALEGMTITPWPMDTHARIRDAKDRKFNYHTKRKGYQSVISGKVARKENDAPTGNHDHEGDYKSLCGILSEIKTNIEENHV